jgi:hypothetical protein
MKVMLSMFMCVAFYGICTMQPGCIILALACGFFFNWGEGVLDKQDAEFNSSPASARVPKDTHAALQGHCCEASGMFF